MLFIDILNVYSKFFKGCPKGKKMKNYNLIAMTLLKKLSNGKNKVLPYNMFTLKQIENVAKLIKHKQDMNEKIDLFDIHLAIQ